MPPTNKIKKKNNVFCSLPVYSLAMFEDDSVPTGSKIRLALHRPQVLADLQAHYLELLPGHTHQVTVTPLPVDVSHKLIGSQKCK